jgi:hypothetical protein
LTNAAAIPRAGVGGSPIDSLTAKPEAHKPPDSLPLSGPDYTESVQLELPLHRGQSRGLARGVAGQSEISKSETAIQVCEDWLGGTYQVSGWVLPAIEAESPAVGIG